MELQAIPVNATAAALNVTAIGGDVASFITIWPAGAPQPWASNVNVAPNGTVANMALTGVTNGRINVRNQAGNTHVVIDVAGYYTGDFTGITPVRVLDTRIGQGASQQPVGPRQYIDVDVRTLPNIPPNAVAVAVNLTATNPSQATFVTAWPAGGGLPPTSNLNVAAGQTVANMALVGLPPSGRISLLNSAGQIDLIADVLGWSDGTTYVPLTPARIMDTRQRSCGFTLAAGEERRLTVAAGGVPGSGVAAVAINLTAVDPTTGGYLAAYPAGTPVPPSSTLNFAAGSTVPNAALVGIGSGGQIAIYNPAGTVHVLVDIVGYYNGTPVKSGNAVACPVEPPPPPPPPPPPNTFPDGTWRVGVDIPAGRYTLPTSANCYWERLRGFSGAFSDIIANGFVNSGQIVVDISRSDAGFSSTRCGTWTRFYPSPSPQPATSFNDGTYVVGQHVYAGLYRATGGSSCYWERLSSFGGSFSEILANDFGTAYPTVRIQLADIGFSSSRCGTWFRLSD